jgi:transcriptional regulator with XRE-family HTH domain
MTAAVPEPMRQFVSNLSREIARRGLPPVEIAARAEIHRSHLVLILAGERMVQLDTLVKLAGALEVPPERLLEGVEWVPDGRGGGDFRPRPEAPPGEED